MMRRTRHTPYVLRVWTLAILVVLCVAGVAAQNTGKIAGTVKDKATGEALVGANVAVKGTALGASTDIEGHFFILRVPPGVHDLAISSVGYQSITLKGVKVQVDLTAGIWVVRTRFPPGARIQRHKHTGHVYAFTQTGSWHYLESPEALNTAGSYLYEPAGSVHTLNVPETNTEVTDVWFTIYGANLNLRDDDSVELVIDAHGSWEDLPSSRAQRRVPRNASDLFAFKANFRDADLRAGAISRVGGVLDHDPEEKEKGFSMALALAQFDWRDHKINLLDTPGFPDFIGEVAAALRVADLAVFLCSRHGRAMTGGAYDICGGTESIV